MFPQFLLLCRNIRLRKYRQNRKPSPLSTDKNPSLDLFHFQECSGEELLGGKPCPEAALPQQCPLCVLQTARPSGAGISQGVRGLFTAARVFLTEIALQSRASSADMEIGVAKTPGKALSVAALILPGCSSG